jgi:hypothetical protein
MQGEGGSHLLVPLVGCPYPVKGLILVAPPNTSMVTNQHFCIR